MAPRAPFVAYSHVWDAYLWVTPVQLCIWKKEIDKFWISSKTFPTFCHKSVLKDFLAFVFQRPDHSSPFPNICIFLAYFFPKASNPRPPCTMQSDKPRLTQGRVMVGLLWLIWFLGRARNVENWTSFESDVLAFKSKAVFWKIHLLQNTFRPGHDSSSLYRKP